MVICSNGHPFVLGDKSYAYPIFHGCYIERFTSAGAFSVLVLFLSVLQLCHLTYHQGCFVALVFRARPGVLTNTDGHGSARLLAMHHMTTTRPCLSILKVQSYAGERIESLAGVKSSQTCHSVQIPDQQRSMTNSDP